MSSLVCSCVVTFVITFITLVFFILIFILYKSATKSKFDINFCNPSCELAKTHLSSANCISLINFPTIIILSSKSSNAFLIIALSFRLNSTGDNQTIGNLVLFLILFQLSLFLLHLFLLLPPAPYIVLLLTFALSNQHLFSLILPLACSILFGQTLFRNQRNIY